MHNHYADITERIAETPKWFDENGVPRYNEPHPNDVANIYADQVAFVRIACQACGHQTLVAFSQSPMERFDVTAAGGVRPTPSLADEIKDNSLHYGDPPNDHSLPGGVCSGVTMNCIDLRVEQFWQRGPAFEWQRWPHLEIDLEAMEDGPSEETGEETDIFKVKSEQPEIEWVKQPKEAKGNDDSTDDNG